jgi:hypothetical protein
LYGILWIVKHRNALITYSGCDGYACITYKNGSSKRNIPLLLTPFYKNGNSKRNIPLISFFFYHFSSHSFPSFSPLSIKFLYGLKLWIQKNEIESRIRNNKIWNRKHWFEVTSYKKSVQYSLLLNEIQYCKQFIYIN